MGKAYDGKKRWNETVRQTTAAAAASAADARASAKKRHSGRTVKLSKAMRSVDAETRAVVRNARLDALEADNYGGEDDALGDGADGADGDELYMDDDDNTKKQRAPKASAGRTKPKAKSHQRRFKVKSLAQLVYEELGTGERAAAPNYLSVAAAPSKAHAPRKFCVVCGFFAAYQCRRCGSRFCRAKCGDQHHESGCLKFGL